MGIEAYDVAAELSDLSQVQKMIDEINAKGKPVDILFNDAAVQIAYRTDYWETPAEDYEKLCNQHNCPDDALLSLYSKDD